MIMGHLCRTGPFWRERGYHFCSRSHHLQSPALLSVSVFLSLTARWRGGDMPRWCTQREQLAGLCLGVWGTALQWWMAVCNVHVMHLFKICSPHCRSSRRWELTCCARLLTVMNGSFPQVCTCHRSWASLWGRRKQKQERNTAAAKEKA